MLKYEQSLIEKIFVNIWYLLQFKPNAYRLAERNLVRQGFQTFLPMKEITRSQASRFVNKLEPLFPGYMFVNLGENCSSWRIINSTLGVSRLVSFDGKPRKIPIKAVSALMSRCDSSGKLLPPRSLSVGDSVELLTGPFANFIATVETIEAKQRIWILLDFMGQSTRMHVLSKQLQISN